jgi:serine/threonine-protein phosphatase 2A regulatory subunit B'
LSEEKLIHNLFIPNLDLVMQMIEKNIFRPLPNIIKGTLGFSETGIEQEEDEDPAWPHLMGIYEFFLQLIVTE